VRLADWAGPTKAHKMRPKTQKTIAPAARVANSKIALASKTDRGRADPPDVAPNALTLPTVLGVDTSGRGTGRAASVNIPWVPASSGGARHERRLEVASAVPVEVFCTMTTRAAASAR
jgi:hypothetical protein